MYTCGGQESWTKEDDIRIAVVCQCFPVRGSPRCRLLTRHPMQENIEPPQDQRMKHVRKRIGKVGQNLHAIRQYVDGLPDPLRAEVKDQILLAFQAGQELSRLDSVPDTPPVDAEGVLRVGPALRDHILATRRVYGELQDLREAAERIFDIETARLLEGIVREERVSATMVTEFTIATDGRDAA